nr:IS3 family transposase [Corynebacterium aquilae]
MAPAAPNLFKQRFSASKPGRLWLTNITEMAADDGKVYLSALIDCFDSKVVGWAVGFNPDQMLVDISLQKALQHNPPDDPKKLVIHSDRGCQYRSRNWFEAAKTVGFQQWKSRKGCSPDNAACEGFFGRLKVEMFHDYKWSKKTELAQAVEDYLQFCNNSRISNALDGMTIAEHQHMLAV